LQGPSRSVDRLSVRRSLVAAALAAILLAATRSGQADALSDLEKAHSAYVAHKYDDAETRLRALLDAKSGGLTDDDNVADARMYLGAVLVAEKRRDEASRVFEQLLIDKPDYQPDPLRVSLEAIDAFLDTQSRLRDTLRAKQAEKVRKAQEEKAKLEEERKQAALRLAMLEKLASEAVVTERNSRWKALVPFGVGQFQNGQDFLGWVFLSSEALLSLGSAAGAGLMLYNASQASDAYARGDGTAPSYQKRAQQASLAGDLFFAGLSLVAVVGVVHAELTFVPERQHVEPRKVPGPTLTLAPTVAPLVGKEGAWGWSVGAAGMF
jgi:hypothetical protein